MVMGLFNRRTAYFGTDLLTLVASLKKEGGLQRYGGTLSPRVESIKLNWIEILEISPTNCRNRKKKIPAEYRQMIVRRLVFVPKPEDEYKRRIGRSFLDGAPFRSIDYF